MLLMFILVAVISFTMFFRDDIARLMQRLDKIPYFFNVLIAFGLTHFMFMNYEAIGNFLMVTQYHINKLLAWLYIFLVSWMNEDMAEFATKSCIKLLIISILILYPYYYKNKFKSVIYADQVKTINMTFLYLLLIVLNIFMVFDL